MSSALVLVRSRAVDIGLMLPVELEHLSTILIWWLMLVSYLRADLSVS